jgi:hypothetical protein
MKGLRMTRVRRLAVFSVAAALWAGAAWAAHESVLHDFTGSPDGAQPAGALIADAAGNLYGTTFWGGNNNFSCGGQGCGVVFKMSPPAQGQTTWSESVIYAFPGGSGGAFPSGRIVMDAGGNIYGGTDWGGTGTKCGQTGCGLVYELSPPAQGQTNWTETTLYSFKGNPDAWGYAVLAFGRGGELVGTTIDGGKGCGGIGCGTVFRLAPPAHGKTHWTESVLYRFAGHKDGAAPAASVILDKHGNLYGTTTGQSTQGSGGTAFMLSRPAPGQRRWTETVLWRFQVVRKAPGSGPYAPLIADTKGNLYGTTDLGGVGCGGYGCGILFELTPPARGGTSWTETTLYEFRNRGQAGAVFPAGGVIAGKEGKLYTTTLRGGRRNYVCAEFVCGAVVMLSPPSRGQTAWTAKVLHRFDGAPTDGGNPSAGLLSDGHGNLFGTTNPGGGAANVGNVYEVRQ